MSVPFWVVLLAWTCVGAVFAVHTLLAPAIRHDSIPASHQAVFEFVFFYAWAAVTPLVIRAGERFRIERGRVWRSIAAHLVIGAVVRLKQTS